MDEKPHRYIKPALLLVFRHEPFGFMLMIFMAVLSGILPLLSIWLIKLIIDSLLKSIEYQQLESLFYWLVLLATLSILATLVLQSVLRWMTDIYTSRMMGRLYHQLHHKSSMLEYGVFENAGEQDKAFRARNELAYRPARLLTQITGLAQNIVSFVVSIALVALLNWWIAFVFLILALPATWFRMKFAETEWAWKRKKTRAERHNSYFGRVLTDSVFAKELRLFNLYGYFINGFDTQYQQIEKEKHGFLKSKYLVEISGFVFVSLVFLAAIVYISQKAVSGAISPGNAVMYLLILQRSMIYIKNIMQYITGIYEDVLGMKNLFEFLQRPLPEKAYVNEPVRFSLNKHILIKNLDFTYPLAGKAVFTNLTLEIPAGKTTVLVGDNGSGKTTLVKLLARLYEPQSGKIFFDGYDISLIPENEFRKMVSVLFQDFVLYHLTARENIGFGDTQHIDDLERIKQAALKAGIDNTIESLQLGYNTPLGFLDDNSVELSIGQWQRIALSRCFFKEAGLILLDEPTSALDAYHESLLFESIAELVKNKTAVIVSHRLSFARKSDYIILLAGDGNIETGTHKQLMEKRGRYFQMFTLQASQYD